MSMPVNDITAADSGGRVFTVRMVRNLAFEPMAHGLVCDHCDWSSGLPPSFSRTPLDIAGEHLATAHDADRGLSHAANAGFRRAQVVVLPLVAVFLIVFSAVLT